MPLTPTGEEMLADFKSRYGDRGEEVFYRTLNKTPKLKAQVELEDVTEMVPSRGEGPARVTKVDFDVAENIPGYVGGQKDFLGDVHYQPSGAVPMPLSRPRTVDYPNAGKFAGSMGTPEEPEDDDMNESRIFLRRIVRETASGKRSAVALIVNEDGQVVMIRRGYEPHKGKWALPGGGVKAEESFAEGAAREAKEETGLDVEVVRDLGEQQSDDGYQVSFHLCRPTGGELQAGDDAVDARWATPIEAGELPQAYPENMDLVNSVTESTMEEQGVGTGGMTTTGDIGIYPGGMKVKKKDLPDEEETAETGIDYTGLTPMPRVRKVKESVARLLGEASITEAWDAAGVEEQASGFGTRVPSQAKSGSGRLVVKRVTGKQYRAIFQADSGPDQQFKGSSGDVASWLNKLFGLKEATVESIVESLLGKT